MLITSTSLIFVAYPSELPVGFSLKIGPNWTMVDVTASYKNYSLLLSGINKALTAVQMQDKVRKYAFQMLEIK